jgi:Uma2 family endonuclease
MATKTLLTVEEYSALEEPEGVRYELSNGELIVTPSASHFHNVIRDKVSSRLRAFVTSHKLGDVSSETDMKLIGEVVRRPDVAFIRAGRLEGVDVDQVPLPVAPDLAIAIVEGIPVSSGWCTGRVAHVPQHPPRLSLRSR